MQITGALCYLIYVVVYGCRAVGIDDDNAGVRINFALIFGVGIYLLFESGILRLSVGGCV